MTRSLAEGLQKRHAGSEYPPKHTDTPAQAHTVASSDAALIIPDQIRLLRLRISKDKSGITINEQTFPIGDFTSTTPVGTNFLMQADRLIDGLRHAYIAINHETTSSTVSMVNPLAAPAAIRLNEYLPQDQIHFSASTAEEFLQLGGEDGFYVFKQLMHGIANTSAMNLRQLLDFLRKTTIPSDLAVGLYNVEELIAVLAGLQHGHTGKGFNPAMLRLVQGRYELVSSVRTLAELFAPGKDDTVGPICPASASRRHVLGPLFNQLQNQFPGANANIDAQNLVCDVLEMMLQ